MQTPKSTLCSVKPTRLSTTHCPTDIPQVEKIESSAAWSANENIITFDSIRSGYLVRSAVTISYSLHSLSR
jgi:hypothetical protein